jgi:hypothetical protein
MRLSDAGLHRRQTKALYPNHRLPSLPTEDATRDRSNRLLDEHATFSTGDPDRPSQVTCALLLRPAPKLIGPHPRKLRISLTPSLLPLCASAPAGHRWRARRPHRHITRALAYHGVGTCPRHHQNPNRPEPVHTKLTPAWTYRLTMRLSDAGLRQRQTKALYPNHRLPPWPNEDDTRDRSNRLLDFVSAPSPGDPPCASASPDPWPSSVQLHRPATAEISIYVDS